MYVLFAVCVIACGVSIWQSATILKMAHDVKEFFALTREMDEKENG